jgi:peptide/nickel transport system permease protein
MNTYIMRLAQTEDQISEAQIDNLRRHYGLDQPPALQYFTWMKNIILHFDFGVSFE